MLLLQENVRKAVKHCSSVLISKDKFSAGCSNTPKLPEHTFHLNLFVVSLAFVEIFPVYFHLPSIAAYLLIMHCILYSIELNGFPVQRIRYLLTTVLIVICCRSFSSILVNRNALVYWLSADVHVGITHFLGFYLR